MRGAGLNCALRICARRIAAAAFVFLFPAAMSSQEMPGFTERPSVAKAGVQTPERSDLSALEQLFQNPPDDSRIMMRWWWFGPAVTKPELEREMRLMKSAGIGGFEVQPVYPLALDDPTSGIRTLPFLSDEFIDALKFVSEKAHELGLRMDLTLGSGWPYGGPQVPVGHAAGQLRLQRTKVDSGLASIPIPSIGAGEKLLAVFLARFQGQAIIPESVREVSVSPEGTVQLLPGLSGPYEVLFFISSRTGMQVKRPAVEAEGFVVDHYDPAAVREYQTEVGDRLMQAFGANPPYAVFCDSLEDYQSDWTGDFLDEFRRRRTYDLRPYLPALMFDMGQKTAGIRHDWGQTLTELFNERFVVPMREWAGQHRTRFRMQGYGIPPAELSSNALADLPEGEGPQWKVVRASRWASSASHLYERPVTSSETWTWIHSPVFRATPLDLKAEADLHFLQGINQLVGHGWPYTAEGVEYPGWRFYAAGALNNQNPWWIVMPDVSLYLQRTSALLRQGQPVNDVALYLPNSDAWAHFSAGRVNLIENLRDHVGSDVMPQVLESGFNLDFFDDDALRHVGRVDADKGVLELGTGRYRAVILPAVERIPLETLQKLADFAHSGGVVIATRRLPALAPGFLASDAEHDQIRTIARSLFEGKSAPAHFIEDEKQLGPSLQELLRPDVSLSSPVPDIGFVHRKVSTAAIYFIANTGNQSVNVNATFRVQGKSAEWWDPMSGRVSAAKMLAQTQMGTTVPLKLPPYGSTVLVVTDRPLSRHSSSRRLSIPHEIDLSQAWQVSFGREGTPQPMNRLESWTDNAETRYFSGLATYEKSIVVPKSMIHPGLSVRLDFGEGQPLTPHDLRAGMQAWLDAPVREAAVVYVNGERAGAVWCPPYSLDVTPFLKAGENRVRITVGNLAVNYMAGHALPDYRLLNLRYGVRFEAQDMDKIQPVASGLLGPIRLIPVGNAE
jgi:hypothetical protein